MMLPNRLADEQYTMKRDMAKRAYQDNCWIYCPGNDTWYTPREFINSSRTISVHRGKPVPNQYLVLSPLSGIKALMGKLSALESYALDLSGKMDKYYQSVPPFNTKGYKDVPVAKLVYAKNAYFNGSWIYASASRVWYTPAEFAESGIKVDHHDPSHLAREYKVMSPRTGLRDLLQEIIQMQKGASEFIDKIHEYYDFTAKPKQNGN